MQEKKANIRVVGDEDIEVLAKSIEDLAKVGERLKSSRLRRRTVTLLLHDLTRVPKRDIDLILDALPDLAKRYLAR